MSDKITAKSKILKFLYDAAARGYDWQVPRDISKGIEFVNECACSARCRELVKFGKLDRRQREGSKEVEFRLLGRDGFCSHGRDSKALSPEKAESEAADLRIKLPTAADLGAMQGLMVAVRSLQSGVKELEAAVEGQAEMLKSAWQRNAENLAELMNAESALSTAKEEGRREMAREVLATFPNSIHDCPTLKKWLEDQAKGGA